MEEASHGVNGHGEPDVTRVEAMEVDVAPEIARYSIIFCVCKQRDECARATLEASRAILRLPS